MLFPAKKAPKEQTQTSQTQEEQAVNTEKVNINEAIIKEASPEAKEIKEDEIKEYALNLEDAEVIFTTKGAAIKDYIYKDIIAPVNLTPYQGEG